MSRIHFAICALASFALACREPVTPVYDGAPIEVGKPYFAMSPQSVTLGQTAPEDPSYSVALQSYPEPTLATVEFDGILAVEHWGGGFIMKIDPRGYWHSGQSYCAAEVSIIFTVQGSWRPGCGSTITNPVFGEQSHVETMATLQGSGTVLRSGPVPVFGSCGSNPCHRYTGTQAVTITPVEAELLLTPQSRSIQPGDSASFIASASPASVESHPVPWRVTGWLWLPDTGNADTVCATSATCNLSSRQVSGTVRCDAIMNGEATTRQARLLVVPCPTNDSCLDEPHVRAGLRDAWNRSRSSGQETGGVLYRRTTDGSCFYIEVVDPNATACTYHAPSGNNIPSYPDAVPIAYWHTHPSKTGEWLVCGPKKQGVAAPYSNGGGSGKLTDKKGDWASSKNAPIYTMSPIAAYRLDPNGDGSTPQYNPNFWFWNTPQCQW